MKARYLFIFSVILTSWGNAQTNLPKKFLDDSLCYKIWLIDNKMGGYDGFEFRHGGELKLLNYDGFTGEKWWTKGERLYVEIRSKRTGKVQKTNYHIEKQTADSLVLSYYKLDHAFSDVYETHATNDFTDKLLGHWDGEKGSYLQIVPKSSFQFELVIPMESEEMPLRAEGFLDKKNNRIIFYLEQERKEMTLFFEDGQETISFGGKSYTRKCSNE